MILPSAGTVGWLAFRPRIKLTYLGRAGKLQAPAARRTETVCSWDKRVPKERAGGS